MQKRSTADVADQAHATRKGYAWGTEEEMQGCMEINADEPIKANGSGEGGGMVVDLTSHTRRNKDDEIALPVDSKISPWIVTHSHGFSAIPMDLRIPTGSSLFLWMCSSSHGVLHTHMDYSHGILAITSDSHLFLLILTNSYEVPASLLDS